MTAAFANVEEMKESLSKEKY